MGGAKCSYKNCTVRSDRQTHMFQYPVLDRPRCHQWLINSNKYNYLSLTVSQLKNRRICQHHFTPDSFMNETMTKLKANSIPTLDGPYCDLEDIPIKNPKMNSFDSVVFEDIENLKYPRRYLEKDTFSKTYRNFLTDSDMLDDETVKEKKVELVSNTSHPILLPKSYKSIKEDKNVLESGIRATKIEIISEETITDPVPIHGTLKHVKPNTILSLPERKYKKTQKLNNNKEPNYTLSIDDKLNITIQEHNNSNDSKPPRTEEDSKSIQIEIPAFEKNVADDQNKSLDKVNIVELKPVKTKTLSIGKNQKSLLKNDKVQDTVSTQSMQDEHQPVHLVKMSADRAMAIQKKRNFNRRLRDMISFQMDLSSVNPTKASYVKDITNDDENKTINMNTSQYENENVQKTYINDSALSLSTPTTKNNSENQTNILVTSHLSEDKSLPNLQSYNTLVAIEARMKHMEELLLTKIEQNTQTIVKLKKSVEEKCLKQYNQASTQTHTDELSNKKFLYREISQYLTADANSLIYEELFINKLVSGVPKRRKIR